MTSSPETSFPRSASLLSLRIGFELFVRTLVRTAPRGLAIL
jgi:hypothetical protein